MTRWERLWFFRVIEERELYISHESRATFRVFGPLLLRGSGSPRAEWRNDNSVEWLVRIFSYKIDASALDKSYFDVIVLWSTSREGGLIESNPHGKTPLFETCCTLPAGYGERKRQLFFFVCVFLSFFMTLRLNFSAPDMMRMQQGPADGPVMDIQVHHVTIGDYPLLQCEYCIASIDSNSVECCSNHGL